jgi:flagellar basal-body rod protein FlgB
MMDVVNLIEKALNVRSFYHKVLSGNIANVETPNYKEKDIDFQVEVQKQMAGTSNIEVKEKTEGDRTNRIDGNTVNMEKQMLKMTENSMVYSSLIQVITKKFSMMRYVINEGKR